MDGHDYTGVTSFLVFVSQSTNSATRCADISITDDDVFEGDQTFIVTLTTPDTSVVLGSTDTVVTITDNDG